MFPGRQVPNVRNHHDSLLSFAGLNRRRKILYALLSLFVVVVLLFGREAYYYTDASDNRILAPPPGKLHSQDVVTYISPAAPIFPPVHNEPIVFSFIMWSEDSAAEGAQLLKTIFMYTSKPVDVHIICDDSAENFLRKRLTLIQRPAYLTRVWFHKPAWQSMLDRVEREGAIKTDHSAGLPGLMKLFIHEIIPRNVTKSIFVDTDALFIADPALLWDQFSTLRPTTAIVMASHPDQNSPDWHNASRICSCIMLLHLEKLRDLRMMDSSIYREIGGVKAFSPEAFKAMYGLPGGDGKGRYDNVRLGDQGYWWAIVDHRPDLFEHLKYDFEVTSCLLQTYNIGLGDELVTMEEEMKHQIFVKDTPQEGITILPKLLHFNCLHGTPRYYEWTGWSDPNDILTKRWAPAMLYHIGYKWIWLNKGRADNPEHRLELFSLANVSFDDQLQLANKKHV